jgi:hypothetical protein
MNLPPEEMLLKFLHRLADIIGDRHPFGVAINVNVGELADLISYSTERTRILLTRLSKDHKIIKRCNHPIILPHYLGEGD